MSNGRRAISESERTRIVRCCYDSYITGDRRALDEHLSADFRFYSPADVGIDRARYFERCWPQAGMFTAYEFDRLFESGDEVIVTYESTKTDGHRFRNTEIFTFAGDEISKVEVYFGWDITDASASPRLDE